MTPSGNDGLGGDLVAGEGARVCPLRRHRGRAARLRFPGENVQPEDRPLLGGHLYRHGIHTASVSYFAERHLAYWFLGNFREAYKPTLSLGNDEDAADINEIAISWLQRNAHKDNWLLHID